MGALGGAEVLRSSLEEARIRQTLGATLDTVLKSMHREGDLKSVLADIRQFTDYSPFRYATGVQAYSGLASNLQAAGQFNRYGGLSGVQDILHNVAEVASGGASPDETLKNVMMHVNAAVGGGRVREGMVTQIGQDIGGSIMPFLTAAIAGDNGATGSVRALADQLRDAAKLGDAGKEKELQLLEGFLHKRNNFLDSKYLLEAFRKAATDPNSPYYHHLEEQADTFTGTGLGNIEIGVLDPLLVRFNNFFDKAKSNRFIDWSEQMGQAARSLDASFASSGGYRQLKQIASSVGELFGVQGLGSLANLTKQVEDPVNGTRWVKTATGDAFAASLKSFTDGVTKTLSDVRGTVDYIKINFETIKQGLGALAIAYGGWKALQFAAGVRDVFGKLGIMNVQAGTVVVTSVPGAGGAGGGSLGVLDRLKGFGFLEMLRESTDTLNRLNTPEGKRTQDLQKDVISNSQGFWSAWKNTIADVQHGDWLSAAKDLFSSADDANKKAADDARSAAQSTSRWPSDAAAAANALRGAVGLAPSHQGDRPHALGGIFTRRHRAIIGESGPEAIVPLSNGYRAAGILARAGFGGSIGHQVTLNVSVSGAGMDEEKLARRIKWEIEDSLPAMLDRADGRMSRAAFA